MINHRPKVIFLVLLLSAWGGYEILNSSKAVSTGNEQSAKISDTTQAELVYASSIRPIIEKRCVVCHACYDAPCQLKLGSFEGLSRGANPDRVYDGERLIEANLTRLFEDAHSTAEWREKDFFPVVLDEPSTPVENIDDSVLAQMLLLKQKNPLPEGKLLTEDFDLDINRQYQCETADDFSSYSKDYPFAGMPYGLPVLADKEHMALINWVEQGARGNDGVEISPKIQSEIARWENFLNQNDNKSQLMSRYLFEHLFLVNLHFEKHQTQQYFKLVRSASKPGTEVKGIFTRRPFDDPEVERVYYRLIPVKEAIVHKSHMPMSLSDERMARWSKWFIKEEYEVNELPSYKPNEASNPFITFAQIPLQTRYKYMLDESQNTIMQFIKGPVCRGQMALNVINDHFWVVFAEPELELVENNNQFMQKARQEIALPAEAESNALPTSWITYAEMEREYLKAKSRFIKSNIENKVKVTLDLLWDGDDVNQNAALTVFRHKDAASVVKGLVGDSPQTAWVLTYPLFERIHYLLVAGYDVYGNLGHQLNSRMYMDFLRMEGEFNFLAFLPVATREKVRNKWYRGSVSMVEQYVYEANQVTLNTDINYSSDDPLNELYGSIKEYMGEALNKGHSLSNGFSSPQALSSFRKINEMKGRNATFLAESTIVKVINEEDSSAHFYTLLRHSAHSNISHLFGEEDRRLPQEDTLTIASGFMTSHPNAFMRLNLNELPAFTDAISKLSTEQDYEKLMDDFGVRRTNPDFWYFADSMHKYFKDTYPTEFGYLDFNRLENR